jgi:membrane-associated protein
VAAIAGAQLACYFGVRAGKPLFERPNSRLFRREYLARAEHYFTRFGASGAVVLPRFIRSSGRS